MIKHINKSMALSKYGAYSVVGPSLWNGVLLEIGLRQIGEMATRKLSTSQILYFSYLKNVLHKISKAQHLKFIALYTAGRPVCERFRMKLALLVYRTRAHHLPWLKSDRLFDQDLRQSMLFLYLTGAH